jgi:GT2 family glycosyltransferase
MTIVTIILNWNGAHDTLECLKSLKVVEHPGWTHRVLVVDNGSTDDSVNQIQAQYPSIELLVFPENYGFAEGNNRAVASLKDQDVDAVILLNNDTVVDRGAFDCLVQVAKKGSHLHVLMPSLLYYGRTDDRVWYGGGRFIRPWGRVQTLDYLSSDSPFATELFSACCVYVPMPIIREIGLFDPRYYLYMEDTDLALRLNLVNYATLVVPEARVWHKISRSSGGQVSPNALYYLVRNNILLVKTYLSWPARSCAYVYLTLLTVKISWNIHNLPAPMRSDIRQSLTQAWRDAWMSRWGKRR